MGVRQGTYVSKKTGKPVWVCDYRDQHGKRHQPSFDTKKAATDHWDKVKAELRQGSHVAETDAVTVGQAWERFKEALEGDGAARATVENHATYWKNHIKPFIENRRLTKLAPVDVKELLDRLRSEGRSDDTLRRVRITLGALIDEAISQGVAPPLNPVRALRRRRRARRAAIAKASAEAVRIPEREDVKALIEGADSARAWLVVLGLDSTVLSAMNVPAQGRIKRMRQMRREVGEGRTVQLYRPPPWLLPFLSTIAFAGLRPGEARGLKWPAVRIEEGFITVETAADRFNEIGPVKTIAGMRQVPIGPILSDILTWWRAECPKTEEDLVYPSEGGRPLTPSNIANRHFGPLQVCLGLTDEKGAPRYTPHDLRHFAVSLWIDEGTEAMQVSSWVGHESTSFTIDTYGHLFRAKRLDRRHIESGEASVIGDARILQEIRSKTDEKHLLPSG